MPTDSAACGCSPAAWRCRPCFVRKRKMWTTGTSRKATGTRMLMPPVMFGRVSTRSLPPALPQMLWTRKAERPPAIRFMAVPTTIWSPRKVIDQIAWMRAPTAAAMMPMTSPPQALPVQYDPATAKNAPVSISPSRPMFMTPDRSDSKPPSAVKSSGVVMRSTAVSSAIVKKSPILDPRFRCSGGRAAGCGAAAEPAPDRRQSVDHLQRGDGKDDQALDELDDLLRDIGGLHRGSAGAESAEEQSGEDDAERMVAADESDGDGGEAVAGRRRVVASMESHGFAGSGEAGQDAGNDHRDGDGRAPVDTTVGRRAGREADGSDFVAKPGVEEHEPENERGSDGDDDADVQPGALEDARQAGVVDDAIGGDHGRVDRQDIGPAKRQVRDEADREVVEHDGRDDLMRAGLRLQEAREEPPDAAADGRGEQAERDVQIARQSEVPGADDGGREAAHDELALDTDIEHAGAGRDGESEAAQDERGGVDEGFGDRAPADEGALPKGLVGLDGVAAGKLHDERTGEQGDDDGADRRERPVEGADGEA